MLFFREKIMVGSHVYIIRSLKHFTKLKMLIAKIESGGVY